MGWVMRGLIVAAAVVLAGLLAQPGLVLAASCPDDQVTVNGACRCQVAEYVPDPTTGICGCAAGKMPQRVDGAIKCSTACPPGQAIGPAGMCELVCPDDQVNFNGACRCQVAEYVADPTTGICGCAAGKVPQRVDGAIKCSTACPTGQVIGPAGMCQLACPDDQINIQGACVCRVEQFVVDPASGICGCPAGKVPQRDGSAIACRNPCPDGQVIGDSGSCTKPKKQTSVQCGKGWIAVNGQCVKTTRSASRARCPDGRLMPANGDCSPAAGSFAPNPFGGLQLFFPGAAQQQPQAAPKTKTPCPNGQPPGPNGCAQQPSLTTRYKLLSPFFNTGPTNPNGGLH